MINFKSSEIVSDSYRETNDCTVKAVAITCDIPYKKAHALMKDAGRVNRKGTYPVMYHAVIKALGFELKRVTMPAKTVASLAQYCDPKKRYMAQINGHVLAVVKGKVEDWSEGRRFGLKSVYEVIPKQSKNAIRKAKRYPK